MKHLFLEIKYVGEMIFPEKLLEGLPQDIVLGGSIQYLDYLPKLKQFLESNGKKVYMFNSRHGQYPGQILGCDIFKFKPTDEVTGKETEFDAFVYLGDGMFHPTALLFENGKNVHIYNPMSKMVEVLGKELLISIEKKKMGMLSKFLVSKNIGVLVTSKPGQNQSRAVNHFRKEMEGKGKNIYVFLGDNVNVASLENFNFIDVWINTACPRIVQDFNCLNLRDLEEINFFSGEGAVF